MSDNYDAHGGREDGRSARDRQATRHDQPLTDREVPLGLSRTPAAIHQWLDGDASEATVRRGDTVRHVEFWKQLDTEVSARRAMRTPAHVVANIMSALPEGRPQVALPWYRRRVELTPVVLAAIGASLLALGLAFGVFAG